MKTWRGIPREEIPWYPTIDTDRCTGCRTCVDFCKNDVLELDEDSGKSRVKNPYNCVVECSTCGKLCPEGAIRFPGQATFSDFIKERIAGQAASVEGMLPPSGDEETIREIYRSRLSSLYRKLKG